MQQFYELLDTKNLRHLLHKPEKAKFVAINTDQVVNSIVNIVKNNLRVFIYSDYDADGAYALECWRETFAYLGFTNYECFQYTNRTHKIDIHAVNQAILGKYDYMIICDAGSSSPDVIAYLKSYGLKIILLDHHTSVYGYEDFPGIDMINLSFDMRMRDDITMLSAGALTACICKEVLVRLRHEPVALLDALGVASMYADVVNMSSPLARKMYYSATSITEYALPKILQRFMPDKKKKIDRRYIEYTVNPRINALFRSERFDLLNPLLGWAPRSGQSLSDLVEETIQQHGHDSSELRRAADLVSPEVLNNFVIANLSSLAGVIDIPIERLHNYTGLLANSLVSKYNRTAVVLADSPTGIKGSVRDGFGRNYLDLFRTFSNAEGHPSAFGLSLTGFEYREFINYIRRIDTSFSLSVVDNLPVILTHNLLEPDMNFLMDVASYNEFSGINCPIVYIDMYTVGKNMKPYKTPYGTYRYSWGSTAIYSTHPLRPGAHLNLKPYISYRNGKSNVRLDLHSIAKE